MKRWLFLLLCCLEPGAWAETQAHILLQDSPLAGFQYHQGKQLWQEMSVGDALVLVREPENPYDARAIRDPAEARNKSLNRYNDLLRDRRTSFYRM